MSNEVQVPKLVVRIDGHEKGTQLRVQKIGNGFIVRTGMEAVFYQTIDEVAEAVKLGLMAINWNVK